MSDPTGNPQPEQPRNPKAEAKAAAAYAKASRPWYKKKRWWLIAIVILIIIIAVAAGSGGGGESGGDSSKDRAANAMKVDAGVILKDFEENEAAADGKYEGKTLQIKGVVEKVDTEFFDEDDYVVRLAEGEQFVVLTVNCNDLSSDEVSSIKKGDALTVLGEFDDGGDLGVELKDCKVL